MLQSFRRAKSSWFVAGFLGLVMIAFIITGIERRAPGPVAEADWVARVDGEAITIDELKQELDRQLAQLRQEQPDTQVDMATLIRSGAADQILDQLIASRAIAAFARDQGLTVSDTMVNREIASAPAFQNVAGKFDDLQFRRWLAQQKKSESALREELRAEMLRRQLIAPVGSGARAPEGLARSYTQLLLETRTGTVGVVPVAALRGGIDPSAQEVAAYYKRNQARYTIPERRVLRYAVIGPAAVAAQAKATDAEIEAAYKANAAEYAPKETRRLAQVVLPSQAAAQAFEQKLAGGTSFAAAASDAGFGAEDIAVGPLTREELAGRFTDKVAAAAFEAAKGAVTAPVQSPLGWHVIRVEEVTSIPGKPLAAVRDELASQVEQHKANEALLGLITRIEDEIDEGSSFEEAVRAHGLAIQQTPPVTAAGAAPGADGYALPAEVHPLLQTGFDLAADDEPVVETITQNQRYALLTLGDIVDPTVPPLAAIADRVRADLVQQQASERARSIADAIVAKVNVGTPMAQAFSSAGVALPPVRPVKAKRVDLGQQDAGVSAPLRAIFSTPAGKAKKIAAPSDAGWFIARTDEIAAGDPAESPGMVEAIRAQMSRFISEEYGEEFVRAIERGVDVERNPASLARLKTELSRGVGQ